MRTSKILLLSGMFLFLLNSCSVCSKFKKNKAADYVSVKNMTELVFGWGGGFTGMIDEYHLSKKGELKKSGSDFTKQLDAKTMKSLLKVVKKVDFNNLKINNPGNMNYFLALKSGDIEQRLAWNDMTALPEEVKSAYEALVALTK